MKGRQDHNSLVSGLINYFAAEGFEINAADFKGFNKPKDVRRHPPDVVAYDRKNEIAFIGEAKVCSELRDNLTKEEFEDFSTMNMMAGKSEGKIIPFVICVPAECQSKIVETFRYFRIPWQKNIQVLEM